MNTISWTIYLINIVSNLSLLVLLSLIGVALTGFIAVVNYGIEHNELHPNWRGFAIIGVFLGLLLVFLPSKSTMYMIVASQVGEQIIQLEEIQALGGEAADLARVSIEALRAQISETIPAKE